MYGRQCTGLGPVPQPPWFQPPRRFRRTTKASLDLAGRKKSPFCAGIRSCSELPARLLMASAPLPRQTKFRGTTPKKRMKSQEAMFQKMMKAITTREIHHLAEND